MTSVDAEPQPLSPARTARVGDLLPDALVAGGALRRLDAAAVLLPGDGDAGGYLTLLNGAVDEFAAWNGRVVTVPADGERLHRMLIVDRYGQVYDIAEGADAASLPGPTAIADWFKFLATACPECGVVDDPRPGAYVL